VLDAMQRDAGPLAELRVDGGATANRLLMQLQADALQRPLLRSAQPEATAWGAAALAGMQAGLWAHPPEQGLAERYEPGPLLDRSAWREALGRVS
ncbi:MAG: glycerol kinase, partial [Burkholderiales bacterium]|nr:glycerol kinase [Burkholderiales bacterium]